MKKEYVKVSESPSPKKDFMTRHGVFVLFCLLLTSLLSAGYIHVSDQNLQTHNAIAPSSSAIVPAVEDVVAPIVQERTYGKPVRMVISGVGIDLPIYGGNYDTATEEWSFVEDSAMLIDNNQPLQKGHELVYIYGHNATDIFLPTYTLSEGDIMEVYTSTNDKLSYEFTGYHLISEHDHYVLDDIQEDTIRLITCQGVGAPHRRLSQFRYLGPSSVSPTDLDPLLFI